MRRCDGNPAAGRYVLAIMVAVLPALAATPPPLVNYQGVLRDATDKPLTGTYDVLFRFMDAATGGNEIMVDQHAAITANAIAVSGGLFNVALGSGAVTDGSGPGTYTVLDAVFRDYGAVWLEVTVGGETLSPRTQVQSAPYALNASQLGGQPAGSFIDTSSAGQIKNGSLRLNDSDPAGYALIANSSGSLGIGVYGSGAYMGVNGVGGDGGYGGSFSGGAYGVLGISTADTGGYFGGGAFGVRAYGGNSSYGAAGYFAGQGISPGIVVTAPDVAANFTASNSYAPSADLASGSTGVAGTCLHYGGTGVYGYAERTGVNGVATGTNAGGATGGKFSAAGSLSVGVDGSGVTGGQFSSSIVAGLSAKLADANSNSAVSATGGTYAGYFQTTVVSSTGVYASGTQTGVSGVGASFGGSFTSNSSGGVGVYGTGSASGVQGHGGAFGAGYFDNANTGTARLAYGDIGLEASGNLEGAEFRQGGASGVYARLAYNATGIAAYASRAGENPGFFQDLSSSSYASLGVAGYKILGTGAVSFVQNDPENSSNVIVYAAPEGDEVAVYTRGSARLVDGEARVALGPTFRKVANPDLGLTANVTPVGEAIALAVATKSTSELVVRGPAGSNAEFDYVVWGLRIGFEDRAVVQPKVRESFIPSRDADNTIYQSEPELRKYSARQRYLAELAQGKPAVASTMNKSLALEQAIGVYDHARDLARIAPQLDVAIGHVADATGSKAMPSHAPPAAPPPPPIPSPAVAALPMNTISVQVAESVEAGDVVANDPARPGELQLSAAAADPGVIGIIAGDPGAVWSGSAPIAVAGSIVLCKVDASSAPIALNELLVASPNRGFAMRAGDNPKQGTVVGKALEPLEGGTGTIHVLVMSR